MDNTDYQERKEKRYLIMRSIMDIGMGFLWTGMGVFFYFMQHFSPQIAANYDENVSRVFGVVCVVYGLFRIFRGIRKKYLRDS
jgi:hypothetical protein